MELKGNFLPQLQIREARFGLLPPIRHDSLLVVAVFTGYFFLKLSYLWWEKINSYGPFVYDCSFVYDCVLNCQFNRKSVMNLRFSEFITIGIALLSDGGCQV